MYAIRSYYAACRRLLLDEGSDAALRALALTLPNEGYLAEQLAVIDPVAVRRARERARRELAAHLRAEWFDVYTRCRQEGGYSVSPGPTWWWSIPAASSTTPSRNPSTPSAKSPKNKDTGCVITSYSIHYTKLYEVPPTPAQKPRRSVPRAEHGPRCRTPLAGAGKP